MYNLIIIYVISWALYEFAQPTGLSQNLIFNLLFIGILLFARFEFNNIYGKDNYLYKKEIKPSYAVLSTSYIAYILYYNVKNILNVIESQTIDYPSTIMYGISIAIFLILLLYVWFKDVFDLNISKTTYSYFERNNTSDIQEKEESLKGEKGVKLVKDKENKDVEVVVEKVEDKTPEKEEIKKVPVIVITKGE